MKCLMFSPFVKEVFLHEPKRHEKLQALTLRIICQQPKFAISYPLSILEKDINFPAAFSPNVIASLLHLFHSRTRQTSLLAYFFQKTMNFIWNKMYKMNLKVSKKCHQILFGRKGQPQTLREHSPGTTEMTSPAAPWDCLAVSDSSVSLQRASIQ